jgi:hypothetical protein
VRRRENELSTKVVAEAILLSPLFLLTACCVDDVHYSDSEKHYVQSCAIGL